MTDQSRGNLAASAGGQAIARQRGSDDEAGYCDFVTSTAHGARHGMAVAGSRIREQKNV